MFSQNRLWEQSQATLDDSKFQRKSVSGNTCWSEDGGKQCKMIITYEIILVFDNPLFLPAPLTPTLRSRNPSMTTHVGSQTHLNTSLSYLNIKEDSVNTRLCSSNMSLKSPSEKEYMRKAARGKQLNTRQKVLLSGVLNRWTSN